MSAEDFRQKWKELIRCPECQKIQEANVEWPEGDPWPTYWHECVRCGHGIGESEWGKLGKTEAKA